MHARRSLSLACMPVSLTCGFHGASLIVDPAAAEEPLLGSTVAVILDEAGDLLGAVASLGFRNYDFGPRSRCSAPASPSSRTRLGTCWVHWL